MTVIFLMFRIPLKGGRCDYSLRASKTQIYHTVWHKIEILSLKLELVCVPT
jgi:hypothetical protein